MRFGRRWPAAQPSHIQAMLPHMTDEDRKRLRETVLAELERRKRLLRQAEDRLAEHPADAAEERPVPEARDA